jgi:hypothetical protein
MYKSEVFDGMCVIGPENNPGNLLSPCEIYQRKLETCKTRYITYVHNDVTIHDNEWPNKIESLFMTRLGPIVAVGLGGALGLGVPYLYKKAYHISQMARQTYISNQDDAEIHGELFVSHRRVAVPEAFFMCVDSKWLKSNKWGGWPVKHLTHHCLDLWLACQAARDGKEIWMTGISCLHTGGGVKKIGDYSTAPWLQGGNIKEDHEQPHRWLYEEYRDVLPIRVGGSK